MIPKPIYGLLAEFKDGEKLVEIAARARDAGYRRIDGFSPYPVEGLAEALGSHRTKVPAIALAGGLIGGLGGYFMLYSSSVAFYPINVARKASSQLADVRSNYLRIDGAVFGFVYCYWHAGDEWSSKAAPPGFCGSTVLPGNR